MHGSIAEWPFMYYYRANMVQAFCHEPSYWIKFYKCCQLWRAITLPLPQEVNLPRYPEGGQLWSRPALTSNQPGQRRGYGKSSSSHNHSSSFHHSSPTPPQELQDATITPFSLLFPPLPFCLQQSKRSRSRMT